MGGVINLRSIGHTLFSPLANERGNVKIGKDKGVKISSVLGDKKIPRILIAEDDKDLREKYQKLFTEWGYEPVLAEDGMEALKVFQSQPDRFSIVISDLDMPKMQGEEFITNLRKIKPSMKVIVISARSYGANFDEGPDHYILKAEFEAAPVKLLNIIKQRFNIQPGKIEDSLKTDIINSNVAQKTSSSIQQTNKDLGGIDLQDTKVNSQLSPNRFATGQASSALKFNLSPEIIQQWANSKGVTFEILSLESGVNADSLLETGQEELSHLP